jgi:tripartite motif-containing protein 71
VSDRTNQAIHIYDPDGGFKRTFEPDPSVTQWAPLGLAFDASGNLYVGNLTPAGHLVLKFDPSGKLLQTFGEGQGMSYPNGIAVDGSGHVIVADGNNGRVIVFASSGSAVATIPRGVADGQLGQPRGVTIDDRGRVVIADSTGHQVRFFTIDPSSGAITYVNSIGEEGRQEGAFEFPNGVAGDARGRVYVADGGNDRVQVWSY